MVNSMVREAKTLSMVRAMQQPAHLPLARKGRTGAALVEFAFVLPIILLFFCAIVELSRLMLVQHSVDTAAYEGARNAMVPGATVADAESSARRLLEAARLTGAVIQIEPTTIVEDTPMVSVHIEVPIAQNAWITPFWFKSGTLVSEVSLITERPPMVQLTGVPQLKAKSTKTKSVSTL